VSEANSDVARRICVAQGHDGFSVKIEVINRDVKVLRSGSERFCLSSFLVSCFYKFPVVIQEAFTE